jgi:sulfur carrier protein ThiS
MEITVSFVGYLELPDVENNSRVTLEEGTTVAAFLTAKGMSRRHQRHIIPIVNEEEQRLSYTLQDRDRLMLFLPVGGG